MTDLVKKPIPQWVADFFINVDAKKFDDATKFFADDADMTFGINHWQGLKEIKENLTKFDADMDTLHTPMEFYDGGKVKVLHGRVKMVKHESGKTIDSAMVHIFYMADDDADKVQATFGAAGPLE